MTVMSLGSRPDSSWRLWAARRLARAAEKTARATGAGAGGVIGGRLILTLTPDAAHRMARGREVVLVSGTNGKTTTTAHLFACLATDRPVVGNVDGANTPPGLVHALASGPGTAVLETDEAWLPWAVTQTQPALTVLLNLSRDQLHRHNEVAALATKWRDGLSGAEHVVANADDPDVAFAALGAQRQTWVALGLRWTQDSIICPACGGDCQRTTSMWHCTRCALRRPEPDWWLEGDDLVSATSRVRLRPALPGQANRANAAVAVASAAALGVPPSVAAEALASIDAVAGRFGIVERDGRRVRLLLAKNPASWVEALDLVSATDGPLVLAFNADGVDGRDPSWLYDVPFGQLSGREVVVTGRRATDLLVRLSMDGLTDVREAPDVPTAVTLLPAGPVDLVANYSAFQQARRELRHDR